MKPSFTDPGTHCPELEITKVSTEGFFLWNETVCPTAVYATKMMSFFFLPPEIAE
jgi:hypothetical protein